MGHGRTRPGRPVDQGSSPRSGSAAAGPVAATGLAVSPFTPGYVPDRSLIAYEAGTNGARRSIRDTYPPGGHSSGTRCPGGHRGRGCEHGSLTGTRDLPDFAERSAAVREGASKIWAQDVPVNLGMQLAKRSRLAPKGCYGPLETTLQQFNQWLVWTYKAAWQAAD